MYFCSATEEIFLLPIQSALGYLIHYYTQHNKQRSYKKLSKNTYTLLRRAKHESADRNPQRTGTKQLAVIFRCAVAIICAVDQCICVGLYMVRSGIIYGSIFMICHHHNTKKRTAYAETAGGTTMQILNDYTKSRRFGSL